MVSWWHACSVQLRVSYDGAAVASGERLTVAQTAAKPAVSYEGADPAGTKPPPWLLGARFA